MIIFQRKNTETYRFKQALVAVFILLFSFLGKSQTIDGLIDSLESALPATSGQEKATVLADLCWYNRQVNAQKAMKYGRRALAHSLNISYSKGAAQAYNDLGILFIDQGNFNKALSVFDSSLTIRQEIKDTLGVAALYNKIGIVHQNRRDIDQALKASLKALKIYEEKNIPQYAAYCLNNIAILYHDQGNAQKAIDFHKKVIFYRKEMKQKYDLGASYLNLGNVLFDAGKNEIALTYLDSALAILKNFPEKEGYSAVLSSMGSIYNQTERSDQAISYLKKAFKLRKQQGNLMFITTTQLNLGRCYFNLGKLDLAKRHLDSALASSLELGIKEHIKQTYFFLSDYYDQVGNTQKAYECFQFFHAFSDSINNEDVNKKVAEMQTLYETEKKEKQILKLSQANQIKELQIRQQNTQIIILILVFLLISGFGIFSYLSYREKQKAKLDQAIIEEQKKGLKAVIEATENERQRIAKDLHDGIGQTLSGIKLSLSQFNNFLTEEKKEKFLNIQGVVDDACTEVRSISHQMMPKSLEEGGLVPAIDTMLEKSLGLSNISFQFDHSGLENTRFEKSVEIGLYRIAQELINNIIKHANATKVEIQLYKTVSHLILFVEDNGKGFTFEESRDGIGLTNIRSRAGTFNGEVNYENAPEKGTIATIRIPLNGTSKKN